MIQLNLRIIQQYLILILKDNSPLIAWYFILNELNGFETELTQEVIYEVIELFGVVFAYQEHMLHLFDLGETSDVVVDYGITTDYK